MFCRRIHVDVDLDTTVAAVSSPSAWSPASTGGSAEGLTGTHKLRYQPEDFILKKIIIIVGMDVECAL